MSVESPKNNRAEQELMSGFKLKAEDFTLEGHNKVVSYKDILM